MNGIKCLENKIMNLEKAMELVLNEAESSALGDDSREVLNAVELLQSFYEEFGHQFANYFEEWKQNHTSNEF